MKKSRGQAMAEFALTVPILTLVIFGIIDFGRLLFTYAQASNALRSAVRYAEVIGYQDAATKVYLDCPGMMKAAGEVFFAEEQSITIKYIKANSPLSSPTTYTCSTVKDDLLANGDILEIQVKAKVKLIAFPMASIPFDFVGRRTIIKKIDIGAQCIDGTDEDLCDRDFDGLADGWERAYYGNLSEYNATDDPDGDGCNNGCEEINGTDPTVHNGTGEVGDTTGIPTPPTAANFKATADCTTGSVSFSWDPVSPIPTRGEIRNQRTGLLAVKLDNDPPGLINQAFCSNCDQINTKNGVKTYYVFFVNGTPPSEVQGANSNTSTVACVVAPPAPVNFYAEPDCATGKVSFSWKWGSTDPLPSRAEIRDASTNAVVYNIPTGGSTTCTDCDTIPIPTGSQSYYLVAVNGAETYEQYGAYSNTTSASCPQTNTAKITGTLWQDEGNPRNQQMDSKEAKIKNVTLYLSGPTGNMQVNTNNDGVYSFPNLPPGDYKLTVPIGVAQGGNWVLDVVRGSMSAILVNNEVNFRVSSGQTITLNFGYKK